MNELDLCRLADTLSLTRAAALICGAWPSQVVGPGLDSNYWESWHVPRHDHDDDTPEKFAAALDALVRAAERGTLKAEKRYIGKHVPNYVRYVGDEPGGRWEPIGMLDPSETLVAVDDLRAWLSSRGSKPEFFFPDARDAPGYLDPSNPRYSSKLAAAVNAWIAVTNPGAKSPKQALDKWLREHAAEFGLADGDGSPVEQAIADCSKVANWNPGGGAPRALGQ